MEPSPADNEVHLWSVDLDAAGALPDGTLTGAELQRRERIRAPQAGRRWAASRWALREILGRYLGRAPGAVELVVTEHGKPTLAAPSPRLEFNLSHSAGLALVAVADAPVGVDVERIDPDRDFLALAKRALNADDVEEIAETPAQQRAAVFYAAWTRHEARLKCGGGGFGDPRPSARALAASVEVDAGYAAAYAVTAGRPSRVRRYRLDLG